VFESSAWWRDSRRHTSEAIYFIAGIFDMLNVACKPLQQRKTLAVGLFYFILLHRIRTSEIK